MLRKEYGARFISLTRRPISGRQKRTRLSAETGHIPGLEPGSQQRTTRHIDASLARHVVVPSLAHRPVVSAAGLATLSSETHVSRTHVCRVVRCGVPGALHSSENTAQSTLTVVRRLTGTKPQHEPKTFSPRCLHCTSSDLPAAARLAGHGPLIQTLQGLGRVLFCSVLFAFSEHVQCGSWNVRPAPGAGSKREELRFRRQELRQRSLRHTHTRKGDGDDGDGVILQRCR